MNDAKIPRQLMTTFDRLDIDVIKQRLWTACDRILQSRIIHAKTNSSNITTFEHLADGTRIDFRQNAADVSIHVNPSDNLRWMKMKEPGSSPIQTQKECLEILRRWISHLSLPLHRMDYNSIDESPQAAAAYKAGRIFQTCAPTVDARVTMNCPNPYRWKSERIAMGPGQPVYIADEIAETLFDDIPSTVRLTERSSLGYEFGPPDQITVSAPEINDPLERMAILASVAHVRNPVVTLGGNRPKKSIV